MNSTVTDQHRLARAFLALGDDLGAAPALRRSATRGFAAFVATLVLVVAAPFTWTAQAKVGDPPAATLGNSKAVLAAADDEDDDPTGR